MAIRYGVKQTEDGAIVRAVEGRAIVGELYLGFVDPYGLWELAYEVRYEAEQLRRSEPEYAHVYQQEAEKLERCLNAFHDLEHKINRQIFYMMMAEDGDTTRLSANSLAYIYHVAAAAAGRRQAVLIAPVCTEWFFGAPLDRRLGKAWKSPTFRSGLLVSGPTAYAQPALAAARNPTTRTRVKKRKQKNPWPYEEQVRRLKRLSKSQREHLYAIMRFLHRSRIQRRLAQQRGDRQAAEQWRRDEHAAEADLERFEKSLGLHTGRQIRRV